MTSGSSAVPVLLVPRIRKWEFTRHSSLLVLLRIHDVAGFEEMNENPPSGFGEGVGEAPVNEPRS